MEYLSLHPQNVQNLDVGLEMDPYFRCLNVKYATCVQIFTNTFRSRKSVLSLARPYFLTGAIIETRSQASLLAPPSHSPTVLYKVDSSVVSPWCNNLLTLRCRQILFFLCFSKVKNRRVHVVHAFRVPSRQPLHQIG